MLRGAVLGALLLFGCSGPSLSEKQRTEVADIARDAADDASSEAAASADISEIENRLDKLEKGQERGIDADQVELDSLQNHNREIQELRTKLEGLVDHYNNHLDKNHGG